jgi:hypothetical protein
MSSISQKSQFWAWNPLEGLSQTYVKRAKLTDFKAHLKSSYENFNPEVLKKMRELFEQEL